MSTSTQQPTVVDEPSNRGLLSMALVMVAVGAMLVYGNLTMRVSGGPSAFGPQTIPWITAALCFITAALLGVESFRRPEIVPEVHDPMTARATVHDPFDETFAPTVLAEVHEAEVEAEAQTGVAQPRGINWPCLLIGVGSLVLFTAILEPLGWLISATVLFWLMSYALGGRRHVMAGLGGLALASAIQVVFSGLLGMSLPAGILGG